MRRDTTGGSQVCFPVSGENKLGPQFFGVSQKSMVQRPRLIMYLFKENSQFQIFISAQLLGLGLINRSSSGWKNIYRTLYGELCCSFDGLAWLQAMFAASKNHLRAAKASLRFERRRIFFFSSLNFVLVIPLVSIRSPDDLQQRLLLHQLICRVLPGCVFEEGRLQKYQEILLWQFSGNRERNHSTKA